MCGLVGIINKGNAGFYSDMEKSFFEMLYADALRGMDSTGVVGVTRHGDFFIAKEAEQAAFVIEDIKALDWYKNYMSTLKNEGKVWLGHNRKTTVGKTNDANAHPFVINNEFAFTHNGTLYNHEKLAKTDVDSKALAIVLHEAMGKSNWKDALEDTLGQVWGAYACAWFDQRNHKVYLLRNSDRPLSIIETNNCFVYASEPAMAWWILTRNNWKDADCKHIQVPPHVLFEFDVDGYGATMKQTELKPKKATAPVVVYSSKTTGASTSMTSSGATSGSATTTTSPGNRPIGWSKKQLKNFRQAHEGTFMRFWVEDYVERDTGVTLEQGATKILLMGDNEDILVKHSCNGLIDLEALGLKGCTADDLISRMWSGTCSWVQYEKDEGSLVLHMTNCKPIVNSMTFRKKQEKAPFPTHPYKTSAVGLVSKAVEERVAKMRDEYEKVGITTKRVVTTSGRVQLINDITNEVMYESAVALH